MKTQKLQKFSKSSIIPKYENVFSRIVEMMFKWQQTFWWFWILTDIELVITEDSCTQTSNGSYYYVTAEDIWRFLKTRFTDSLRLYVSVVLSSISYLLKLAFILFCASQVSNIWVTLSFNTTFPFRFLPIT